MATPSPDVPFPRDVVDTILNEYRYDPNKASIREVVAIVGKIEQNLNCRYLRMEFGVPGLLPDIAAVEGEGECHEDLRNLAMYSPMTGLPQLKSEASRFLKLFGNVDIPETYVIPTVGSMQGAFLAQAVLGRRNRKKDRILFIDPCFSVHRVQNKMLGLREASVDLYDRKHWLSSVEELCAMGDVAAVLFSSPNNPTWIILTDDELRKLGEICTRYDVVAVDDAAYFAMDFRSDYSKPGEPPYPPSIARYADQFMILLSASKIFNYAGQRVGLAYVSPKLAESQFPDLDAFYSRTKLFDAFVLRAMYCTTSGVSIGPQHGLANLMKKANEGGLNFVAQAREYARRAKVMKTAMIENGFRLVYDQDQDRPLADGFFFTFAYPGMSGGELARALLYYGISATTLQIAYSSRTEAVRACVSQIAGDDLELFARRVAAFHRDHSN